MPLGFILRHQQHKKVENIFLKLLFLSGWMMGKSLFSVYFLSHITKISALTMYRPSKKCCTEKNTLENNVVK